MKGVFGKYLDVDLTNEKISDYKIPEEWYEKHLGGRGIAARIMLKELEKGIDPLGERNIIIFAIGPLQGTGAPGGGRNLVMAKSPRTNAVSDSFVGGFFPHELGRSGYDGIIICGKARIPKYLTIINGKPELHDAKDLWGMTTGKIDEELKKRHPGVRVSCIGPGGEKLISFACIVNDRNRAAGRPGFGAVMGSKKLKAIAIKGNIDKTIDDKAKLLKANASYSKLLLETKQGLATNGTSSGLMDLNKDGILPTKNFQEGVFDDADKISGPFMTKTILKSRDNCTACPIRCKRVVVTEFKGEKVDEKYGGPEYETVAALGSLCMVDDLKAISLANQICNSEGIDTISMGVSVAFAMEASEKGLLKGFNYKIEWGDAEAMVELVKMIANKEGIGDLLATGVQTAAKKIGGSDFAMHVKGQEIPMHEPRGKKGLGLSYAVSPRGATHLETMHDPFYDEKPVAPELGLVEPLNRFNLKDKPRYVKIYEDLVSFTDTAIICRFTTNPSGKNYNFPLIREMLGAVTGVKIDAKEMLKIGERNFLLLKLLAFRDGYTRNDDFLHKRFSDVLPRGGSEGQSISEEEMQEAIDEYYKIRGLTENGITKEKLEELDLSDLI